MFKFLAVLALCGVALGAPTEFEKKFNSSLTNGHYDIIGGKTANIANFPWQVSVQYIYWHFCGGILITPDWVLTAAHCITDGYSTRLNVRAGSNTMLSGGVTAFVDGYVLHPKFIEDDLNFDAALLRLATSISGASISPARLPAAGQDIAIGATLTVTGWGATSEDNDSSSILLQVSIPVISHVTCRHIYGSTFTTNMFCAGLLGVGGKDHCYGDSGGPAVVNGEVVGIVTGGGDGCARPNSPGVYSKISTFRNFIKQYTGV